MMRRSAILCSMLFLLSLRAQPSWAETARDDRPYVSALRSLSINRSLLTRAEAEYRSLLEQEEDDPAGPTAKRLSDLRYKIQALNEDAQRLHLSLPSDEKADDFLQEVVRRKNGVRGPVDVETEKRIAERVSEIYRLHEKALSLVAERRFGQAERIYEEIVLTSPDDDEAYLLLGHTCLAGGRYEKAASAFHNALHIDPSNAAEIPRLYENILVENPSDDEAMTLLGYAHLLLGGSKEARLAFEDALAVNPANVEARRGLMELST